MAEHSSTVNETLYRRIELGDGHVSYEPVIPAQRQLGWVDQNHQIDRYGVALMMIREGCADPVGLARRILGEFGSALPSTDGTTHDK